MPTVNVNCILVGADLFSDADFQEVDHAVHTTRALYAQVGLALGSVEFWAIPVANARGREHIDDNSEAVALTDEWTVPNHALDLFFVRTYAGPAIGISRVDGPCDKNAKGMDGSVVAIEGPSAATGAAMAHELAHYLGLGHDPSPGNLMFEAFPNGGELRADQGANMNDHCFVF